MLFSPKHCLTRNKGVFKVLMTVHIELYVYINPLTLKTVLGCCVMENESALYCISTSYLNHLSIALLGQVAEKKGTEEICFDFVELFFFPQRCHAHHDVEIFFRITRTKSTDMTVPYVQYIKLVELFNQRPRQTL